MASTTNHGYLPEDVMLDIVLRLPVKTLLQFKCVSTYWCTLIESPGFVKRHFNHKSNPERLLVRNYRPDTDEYAYALFHDETFSGFEEPDHLQMPITVGSLLGPVDGLFLVVGRSGNMALLNPSMRQLRPIPLLHPDVKPHLSPYDDLLGFGWDESGKDYKVISIQYFWNDELDIPHDPSIVSIYSLRSDSWRHFEDVDLANSGHCSYKSLCNTYLNGVYYWFTELNDQDVSILAFDMSLETFCEIKVPDCIKARGGDLALYGDSVALISCDLDRNDKCVDIWVLKEESCWIKCLNIGPFEDLKWPLGFWRDTELLLETGSSHLTVYNINTKKLRTLETRRRENGFFIYWVFFYKESLVSINGEGLKCMQWDPSSDSIKDLLRRSQ
ncbi:F-box protein CPR1-like [Primulina tabacum]|uniref:F-box protein CPR1-like n=1 Tax=Primulina tabacum TaxID=48773 RepID=UPI003F598F4E